MSSMKTLSTLQVPRKGLVAALRRLQAVAAKHSFKPILTGVRLQADHGHLILTANDGEVQVTTQLPATGHLAACVVGCAALLQRVRASRSPQCELAWQSRFQRLIVNGGAVAHTLPTLPLTEFPATRGPYVGATVALDPQVLLQVLPAVATEPGRYALSSVLLKSDDDGVRLAATDGRRLAIAALPGCETTYRGEMLLPKRICELVKQFSGRGSDTLSLTVQAGASESASPANFSIAGPDWVLCTQAAEGHFPKYREVIPTSAARFVTARPPLITALQEVAVATHAEARRVLVELSARRIGLSAASAESGAASARLPARFLGGGDRFIRTAFNPDYLLAILQSLSGEQVVFDVGQNGCSAQGQVFGKPAILHAFGAEHVRWVLMPVDAELAATRANLGSNYRERVA